MVCLFQHSQESLLFLSSEHAWFKGLRNSKQRRRSASNLHFSGATSCALLSLPRPFYLIPWFTLDFRLNSRGHLRSASACQRRIVVSLKFTLILLTKVARCGLLSCCLSLVVPAIRANSLSSGCCNMLSSQHRALSWGGCNARACSIVNKQNGSVRSPGAGKCCARTPGSLAGEVALCTAATWIVASRCTPPAACASQLAPTTPTLTLASTASTAGYGSVESLLSDAIAYVTGVSSNTSNWVTIIHRTCSMTGDMQT